jgi:hypothetical protein
MDPINTLIAAIVAGSVVATQDVATQAVKDGYAALKALLVRKFGETSDVADALQKVENKPNSEARQALLKEELDSAGASQDLELVQRAQAFLTLLEESGLAPGRSYHRATLTGSGAIAQGKGAVAAGERGVAVGGDVKGGAIVTGDKNVVGDSDEGDR